MSIFDSGLILMLYGMGTVFVFLTTLIFLTIAMSYVVGRFFPQTEVTELGATSTRSATIINTPTSTSVDPQLLDILQAAVDTHRQKHRA